MKIAVSGTHSSGKTTIVNWLYNISDVYCIPEFARNLLNGVYNFNEIINNLYLFLNFEEDIIEKQIEAESKYKRFVVDRALIDAFCYLKFEMTKYKSSILDKRIIDRYKALYKKVLKHSNYDAIIFLRLFGDIEDDPSRNMDFNYASIIESIIFDELHKNFRSILIEVNEPDLEKRKKLIWKALV